MATYFITYDLRKERTSAAWDELHDALRSTGTYCWPLQSAWIIETSTPPSGVIDVLVNNGVIDDNDGITVLEITGAGAWRRVKSEATAKWLAENITYA